VGAGRRGARGGWGGGWAAVRYAPKLPTQRKKCLSCLCLSK
jgi:hypothetical protein